MLLHCYVCYISLSFFYNLCILFALVLYNIIVERSKRFYLCPLPWLILLLTLSYTLRLFRSPILVVKTMLFGIWYTNCSPLIIKKKNYILKNNPACNLKWIGAWKCIVGKSLFFLKHRITCSEVVVGVWRFQFTPFQSVVQSVFVMNTLPAFALTVWNNSK